MTCQAENRTLYDYIITRFLSSSRGCAEKGAKFGLSGGPGSSSFPHVTGRHVVKHQRAILQLPFGERRLDAGRRSPGQSSAEWSSSSLTSPRIVPGLEGAVPGGKCTGKGKLSSGVSATIAAAVPIGADFSRRGEGRRGLAADEASR